MGGGCICASCLDLDAICTHLRLEPDYVDETEEEYLMVLKSSAIAYVCDHCNVTADYVDDHPDLGIAVLVLISDMYDERGRYVDGKAANRTVEAILSHHDHNLVPCMEVGDASR